MNVFKTIFKNELRIDDNHPAIITSRETISYKQLNDHITAVAAYLNSVGVGKHSTAAILSRNTPEYVVYLFALWHLNACVIPLNAKLLDDELTGITDFSDADFLFCDIKENRNISSEIKRRTLDLPLNENEPFDAPPVIPEKISLVMFTSGVTGKPKGVMHSLADLINSADNSQTLLKQSDQDRWLASLPFYHIGGLSIIIRAFRFGSTLVIPDSLKITDLISSFDNLRPSLASIVSTQLKRLLESDWRPGKELRNILLGGGFTDHLLIKEAISRGCKISNVYGSTETSAFVAAGTFEKVLHKPLTVGKALGDNKISIVDDYFKQVSRGNSGEILVEGNTLFHGYYKDVETTRSKLKEGKFLTGDIGYIDNDGDLFVEARRTDLIITGGENVNPIEVENVLNNITGVYDSCVFALPDKEWGHIVAAAIVADLHLSLDEITKFMKGKVSGYKIPKKVFAVEKIPKTSLGKIMREKVKEEIENLVNQRH